MRRALLPIVIAVSLAACAEQQHQKDIGKATADISEDTATLGEATAAVNRVIRVEGDCDAVKAALPETTRTLESVRTRLKTIAGQASFEALRSQVKAASQSCGL